MMAATCAHCTTPPVGVFKSEQIIARAEDSLNDHGVFCDIVRVAALRVCVVCVRVCVCANNVRRRVLLINEKHTLEPGQNQVLAKTKRTPLHTHQKGGAMNVGAIFSSLVRRSSRNNQETKAFTVFAGL